MKQVYKYDKETGIYIEPVIIYPSGDDYVIPDDCTDKELPKPCWKPVFKNGEWVETISYEELLAPLKAQKISELNSMCESTIFGRFIADVNGEKYQFSNDAEAQSNFEKCDRAFEKGRITEIPWTAYTMDGEVVRLLLDGDSFEQVYLEHLNHIQSNISKFRDSLMPKVLNAMAIEEVESITW